MTTPPKPPIQAGVKMDMRKREDVDSDKQKASGLFHPEVSVINTPYPRVCSFLPLMCVSTEGKVGVEVNQGRLFGGKVLAL